MKVFIPAICTMMALGASYCMAQDVVYCSTYRVHQTTLTTQFVGLNDNQLITQADAYAARNPLASFVSTDIRPTSTCAHQVSPITGRHALIRRVEGYVTDRLASEISGLRDEIRAYRGEVTRAEEAFAGFRRDVIAALDQVSDQVLLNALDLEASDRIQILVRRLIENEFQIQFESRVREEVARRLEQNPR